MRRFERRCAGLPAALRSKRRGILRLAAKHGATHVRFFGSFATGNVRAGSDLDLLVDMEPGRDYLDLVALWQELRVLVGRKVDVVTERGLSPFLRERILSEARPL